MADYRISLGVELDDSNLISQIRGLNPSERVRIGVELDDQVVQRQIADIRRQIQDIGNIRINLGGNGGGGNGGVRNTRRQIDDTARAYRELISLQNRIGSKQQKVARLDTRQNQREILELSNQIDNLVSRYQRIHQLFNGRFSDVQLDGLNRGFQVTSENLDAINRKVADARAELARGINLDIDNGSFNKQVANIENEIRNLINVSDDVQTAMNNVRLALSDMRTASANGDINELISANERYVQSLKTVKNQLDINKISNTSDVEQRTRAYRELLSISKQIGSLELNITKLRGQGGNTNQISVFENQLRELRATYQQLVSSMNVPLTDNQWRSINTQISQTYAKIEQLQAKIADDRNGLANSIRGNFKAYDAQTESLVSDFEKLSNKSAEVQSGIDRVRQALADMRAASVAGNDNDLIAAEERYQRELKETEAQLRRNASIEKRENNETALGQAREKALLRLNGLFENGSAAAKRFGGEVQNLQNRINACGNLNGMKSINRDIDILNTKIKQSNLSTETFASKLKTQFDRYKSYLSVATVLMYATQGLKDMFNQVRLIDTAMTELRKVTDETDASYDRFLNNAASRAKEIGTTVDGLVSSTADFARLGYNFTDSQGLAEVANIYAVVGDEIDGVEGATQSLISTLAAFKHEMGDMSNDEFALSIVDKMNEVANNYAISSGGLGEALQRSASSMAAANNTLDESIAMITAANEVAQNPEKVGNAMKTISMRIRGAKTELEAAGESTDGMAESTAKLREEIIALSGVDIMLNEDTFKSTYQIMDELSQKWEGLSDIAQASIIELMAGKHQGNIMSSLMANFDTARNALETSMNSAGSAMAEHAKWSESLDARLLKLKATWQSLSQSFMSSDFLKGALDVIIALVDAVDELINTFGTIPTLLGGFALFKGIGKILNAKKTLNLVGGVRSLADVLNILSAAFPGVAAGISSLTGALGGLSAASGSAGGALAGLLGVLTNPYVAAAVFMVTALTASVVYFKKQIKDLSKQVGEATSSYKEQHAELSKLKGDYDTSNEDSMISRYRELSKGVDGLGENISLTTEEYAEYQSIVDQIIGTNPDLIAGYNSQGNAILKNAGDVDALAESYKNLIKEQNKEILLGKDEDGNFKDNFANAKDALRDFNNDLRKTSAWYETETDKQDRDGNTIYKNNYSTKHLETLKNLMSLNGDELKEGIEQLTSEEQNQIAKLLESSGIQRDKWLSDAAGDGLFNSELTSEYINRAITNNVKGVKTALDDASSDLNAHAEDLSTITSAYFDQAFLGGDDELGIGDYSNRISERMQGIIGQTASNLGADFFADILNIEGQEAQWQALTERYNSILDAFANMSSVDAANLEAAFNLRTQFNDGDISYGEYIDNIQNISSMIDELGLEPEVETAIKMALNTDGIIEQYETTLKRLQQDFEWDETTAENFLNSLSADEFSILMSIIPKLDGSFTQSELQAMIDKEMALKGLTVKIKFDVEKANLEAVATALSESVSGSGLTPDSIKAIEGIFKNTKGYDPSKLFERTANGIRLNSDEFRKLNSSYKDANIAELNSKMSSLGDIYNQTREELYKLTYGTDEYNKKAAELRGLENQINQYEQLAASIEGLSSAYQEWQIMESSGSQRDMYENIIAGFKNVDNEISRGWYDDGTVEFIELLSGQDLSLAGIEKVKEAWKSVGEEIGNSGYSIRDFFTVDEDGNSTNAGVYNFLETVDNVFGGKGIIKEDGNIVGFNFDLLGGDEAVADALETSEEIVQILVRAADDAGFVVQMDGTYQQLDVLREKAQLASESLKEIRKANGQETFDFNFNTSDIDDISKQLTEAQKLLDTYRNTDNTINTGIDGADEALTVASTLQSMMDRLTRPAYMSIQASQVEESLREPLNALQDYRTKLEQLNQAKLHGADTTELEQSVEEAKTNAVNALMEIQEHNPKLIPEIEGLTREEIAAKVEAGEITIPATIDIQLEMSEQLGILVDKALLDAGLIDQEEFEKRVNIYLDADVDSSGAKEETEQAVDEVVNGSNGERNRESGKTWTMDADGTIRQGSGGDGSIEVNTNAELKIDNVDVSNSSESIDGSGFTMDSDGTVRQGSDGDGSIEVESDVELKTGKIDASDVDKDIDKVTDGQKGKKTTRTQNIEIIAETFGVEDIDKLSTDLEGLDDKTVQAVANVLGKMDVDKLNAAILSLDDKTVQAIAQALGQGDVEGLKLAIGNIDSKTIQVIAEALGYENVEQLTTSIDSMDTETVQVVAKALGIGAVNNLRAAINRVQGRTVNVTAIVSGLEKVNELKNAINSLESKTITITVTDGAGGGTQLNGTANVMGTAFANGTVGKSGTAFKKGDWGVKKTQVALTGELGPELVVHGSRWYTVGDTGAEFAQIPKGAIVFNHKQTEELFKNGKVTSYGGRGRAYASGTAFAEGTAFSSGSGGAGKVGGSNTATSNSSTGSSYKPSSSDGSSANQFEETVDWIEIAIDRIERAIEKLDTKANSIYRSWSERNTSLVSEISKVREEIDLQQKAYDEYIKAAEGTDLSEDYAKKVRDGTIDIETIKDEVLKKRIDDYRKYYEAALDAEKAVNDLREKESELYKQRFDVVSTRYDGYIGAIEHEKSMLEEYMNQSEAQAWLTSSKYYDALISNQLENIAELENKKAEMTAAFNDAMDSGTIVEGSEAWNEMVLSIDEVALAIQASKTQILEYDQAIQELEFDIFDLLQDKISGVTNETEFLIDLLSNKKLYDDNGKLTNDGFATVGLHGVAYNTYMHQADLAAKEVEKLKKELAEDPFDTELEERYREMIELQQEHILAAEKEKDAIKTLVEEGIELELDALNERIDKYKESVDSARELYEYNRKVKEQTEEIASLEKQMSAFSGDDSEEARQKVQKIKVDLEEARANLEETEYDKWVEDSERMLDDLYLEYETILNTRLDNVDALISDMIAEINNDAVVIGDTIREAANSVGYTLTDSMKSIWDENTVSTKNVITTYGDKFTNAQTTTNNTLNVINTKLQNMISQLNKKAATNTTTASQSSVTKPPSSTNNTNTTNKPSGDGTPKVGDRVKFISGQYYYDSYGQKPLGSHKQDEYVYITNINKNGSHPYHISTGSKLGKGDLGWLKLNQISGYASGKKNFSNNEIAWTQEDGMEYIVRPSDGAILTPVAKRDSILNHAASNNIWDMANNPAEFIKNHLNLGLANIPNNSNVQNNYTQYLDNVTFSFPNVQNYEEMLSAMQKDKRFENLVLSMSIDRLAGKSVLTKGKSIR